MAVVWPLIRPAPASEYDLVDQLLDVLAFDLGEDAVELSAAARRLATRCAACRESWAAPRSSAATVVVDAMISGTAPVQRFGGRHVGEDHELLDQRVRLEPLRRDDASTVPSASARSSVRAGPGRGAAAPRGRRKRIGGVQRRYVVGSGARRRGRRRSRPGPAGVSLAATSSARVEACAILQPSRPMTIRHRERARSFGGRSEHRSLEMRSQHRHDAVGEIDRVAALDGLGQAPSRTARSARRRRSRR